MVRWFLFLVFAAAAAPVFAQTPTTTPDGDTTISDIAFDFNLFDYFDIAQVVTVVATMFAGLTATLAVTGLIGGVALGGFFGPLGALLGAAKGAASAATTALRAFGRFVGGMAETLVWIFIGAAVVCSVLAFAFDVMLPAGVNVVLNLVLSGDAATHTGVQNALAWVSYLWWMLRVQEVLAVYLTSIGFKWLCNAVSVVTIKQPVSAILH